MIKSDLFSLEEEVFKVMANHKRLEIIQLLKGRELNVGEMIAMLGLRQSNLSQHLALLRQHRIVEIRRVGREVYYRLADDTIADAVLLVRAFLRAQHRPEADIDPGSIFPIVVDPVCGMRFSATEAYDNIKHDEQTYYFCASGCKAAFEIARSSTDYLDN